MGGGGWGERDFRTHFRTKVHAPPPFPNLLNGLKMEEKIIQYKQVKIDKSLIKICHLLEIKTFFLSKLSLNNFGGS